MQKETAIAIVIAAVAAPLVRYVFLLPGRWGYRYLWKHMPEGRLRSFLLKKRGSGQPAETWPKLPPGP